MLTTVPDSWKRVEDAEMEQKKFLLNSVEGDGCAVSHATQSSDTQDASGKEAWRDPLCE